MRDHLTAIDPLPELDGAETFWDSEDLQTWIQTPMSRRQIRDEQSAIDKRDGEDWRPTDNPLIEVNGKGQMRTKDYPLPEPPETDIPIPCVHETFDALFQAFIAGRVGQELMQAASQREQGGRAIGCGDKDLAANPTLEVAAQFDGWIPHKPGDPMPCDREMRLHYRCVSGQEYEMGVTNRMINCAADLNWGADTMAKIIAWKPAT
jgi:hypothetical protein